MVHREPYAPEHPRFECRECDYSSTDRSHAASCPECGSRMNTSSLSAESDPG